MTATAMKTWKTNGVLLRNRQIHDIVGQTSPSYVFGRHGLWVAVIVELWHLQDAQKYNFNKKGPNFFFAKNLAREVYNGHSAVKSAPFGVPSPSPGQIPGYAYGRLHWKRCSILHRRCRVTPRAWFVLDDTARTLSTAESWRPIDGYLTDRLETICRSSTSIILARVFPFSSS